VGSDGGLCALLGCAKSREHVVDGGAKRSGKLRLLVLSAEIEALDGEVV
jgi:hypothetical protein